jgi:anti-anti-sigma factor
LAGLTRGVRGLKLALQVVWIVGICRTPLGLSTGTAMADVPFSISPESGGWLVLVGELDMATAPALEKALHERVGRGAPILLDLSSLTFIDGAGLSAVLSPLRDVNCGGIVLRGARRNVQRVFDIADLAAMPGVFIVEA